MGSYSSLVFDHLNSSLEKEWNEVVEGAEEGTLFHSFEWCKMLEEYGKVSGKFEPYYIIVLNELNKPVGILPLFLTEKENLISPPYGDYGGPCVLSSLSEDDKKTVIQLILSKSEEIAKGRVKKVLFKTVHEKTLGHLRSFGYATRPKYFTFLLPLTGRGVEDVWRILRRDTKRGIRKAQKSGLLIEEIVEKSSLKSYYEIYKATMRKLGASIRPFSFFETLWDVLHPKRSLYILLAKHADKYVAGIISISWKKTLHIFGNVSLPESYKLHPNDLVYYETIKWALENNYEMVDFGLTPINKEAGLYRFKERWGGNPKTLYAAWKEYRKIPGLPFSKIRSLIKRAIRNKV